jgi:sterol desaturase/sphingolipid hydroxylase (fatty acid hydroxylase superfamily)
MSEQSILRLSLSLGLFLLFSLLEALSPKRKRRLPRSRRWLVNLAQQALNSLTTWGLFSFLPFAVPVFVADWITENNLGLMQWLDFPLWLSIPLGIILLDLVIYWQHRLFHTIPFLWSLHKVHHQDKDLDSSSAFRFHTVEILLSLGIKIAFIVLLGVPFWGVFLFEVILNGLALFNHANLKIPAGLDRFLRFFVVTPDMHRVHHSTKMRESNKNFGFNIPWWDKIFGSYQEDFENHGQQLGLPFDTDDESVNFGRMLFSPLRKDTMPQKPQAEGTDSGGAGEPAE